MTEKENKTYQNLKFKYEKSIYNLDIFTHIIEDMKKENEMIKEKLKQANKTIDVDRKRLNANCNYIYNKIAILTAEFEEKENKKKLEIKFLKKEIKRLTKENEMYRTVNLDLNVSVKKDSTNSSMSPSSDKYVAPIYNNRKPSSKSKGGQLGRKTTKLQQRKPDIIEDVLIEGSCECGGNIVKSNEYVKKQILSLKNKIETLEKRYYTSFCDLCGKEFKSDIPAKFMNKVQYSKELQATIVAVKNIANTSVGTTKNIFNVLTRGDLNLSVGYIHKSDKLLSSKCDNVIENIKANLINASILHSDETGLKIEDKLGCCITLSDKENVLYNIFLNKKKCSFDSINVYQNFKGILVHDHLKTYYNYLILSHAECNAHICRYLEEIIVTFNRKGAKKLKEFLLNVLSQKFESITNNKSSFSKSKVESIKEEYTNILNSWKIEYEEDISKYNNIPKILKKEYNLFTRLLKYIEEHLRFATNFEVPFTNNEAERNLRGIKVKMNVSKRFGKLECAESFGKIKSIIETCKKRDVSIIDTFEKILIGNSNNVFST